jgi:plastocyanin
VKRALALAVAFVVLLAGPAFADKVKVNVTDAGFDRSGLSLQQGDTVKWNFSPENQADHEVRGPFFDSGPVGPGGTFSFQFTAAGKYTVVDLMNPGASMLIKVPTDVDQSAGSIDTTFNFWMNTGPDPGYFWSVQYEYPGAADWGLLYRQVGGSFSFKADHGPGTYRFRAKTHKFANPDHTDWSAPVSILVTP